MGPVHIYIYMYIYYNKSTIITIIIMPAARNPRNGRDQRRAAAFRAAKESTSRHVDINVIGMRRKRISRHKSEINNLLLRADLYTA